MKKAATPDPKKPPKQTAMEVLSLHYKSFNITNKLNEDCFEQLLKYHHPEAQESCKICGSRDLTRKDGARVGRCNSCKEKYHVTAGTFFEKIHLPRPWLWAIRLKEEGVSVNAHQFSQIANIAYDTAWTMFRKLDMVIADELEQNPRAGCIPSGAFCRAVNKRSLETPANQHPTAEQTKMEEQERQANSSTSTDDGDASAASPTPPPTNKSGAPVLSGPAQKIFELLSSQPLHFNDLVQQSGIQPGPLSSILMMLELDGLILALTGDTYGLSPQESSATSASANSSNNTRHHNPAHPASPGDNTDDGRQSDYIDIIIGFFKDGFHGISRKYLQLYLAGFWCYVDKRKWSTDSLLKACSNFRAVTREDIQAFVSPLSVRVPF